MSGNLMSGRLKSFVPKSKNFSLEVSTDIEQTFRGI